jgi:hypothetical protein
MATWSEVERLALALPETSVRERERDGMRQWRVRDKLFVWERPLRAREMESLGGETPSGPILAARVEHLHAKEALLAANPDVYFTTSHFDGNPAVLARLECISSDELAELVTEAWLARAPARLARDYLDRSSA